MFHQARNLTLLDTTPGFSPLQPRVLSLSIERLLYVSDLDLPFWSVIGGTSGRFHEEPCQETCRRDQGPASATRPLQPSILIQRPNANR